MTSKETAPGSNNVPPIPEPPKDFLKNSPFVRGEEQEGGSWFDLMHDIQQTEDAKESNPGLFRRAGERISGWAGKVKENLGDTALGAIGARIKGLRSKGDDSRHIELTTPDSEADRNSVEDDQDEVSTSTPESQSGDSGGDEKNDKPVDGGEQQKQEIPEAESRILEGRRKRVEAAKERLADVAKKYGEKSEAYKRAKSDLRLREDFLRNLESEFGSPAEHSDETDGDKPEQDKSPAQTEVNSSDDQDTSSSSVESEQDESGAEEDQQQKETPEARLINRRRASVDEARQRLDAIKDEDSLEYHLAAQDVEAAEIQLQAVEDQFGSSEQIKEESGTDGKRDDIEDKNKGSAESQETSESEDDKKDKKSPEAPTPEDAARAKIAELEEILNDDNATEDEKYRAAYMRKQLLNGLMSKSSEETKPAGDASTVETDDSSESETVDDSAEETKKDLKKERSAVAKELAEAMRQLSKHNTSDPDYDKLLKKAEDLRNRFNYIGKQIKGELDTDEERDSDKEKGKEPEPKGKELVPYDSRVADLDKAINDPEADGLTKYEGIIELKQKVIDARNKYAEIRAEYEQMGTFKGLFKGKELKKRMELARAELEGYMTQLVYHQKDQERSIIKNGVEGANEEEQKEARQKAIQSIAAAVLEQHALVDEKTQEEYDKRLDERSLFKKVAAKIGRWFVGKENKDGGKLGLGGWLRSGGTGLAAGVATGLLGAGFPITSAVGAAGGAGVKVAAHQRALENARGDKRELSDEGIASFGSAAQSLEWTAEDKDGSGRKDQSKEAVASMVGAALAETQRDTEKRQKNMTAIGSKAAMGWGLGVAAGRITTELIKSHMIPDQKLANTNPGNGGDGGGNPGDPGSGGSEATQPGDVTEVPEVTATPPSEISLGSDGWVWDRVADVLGAEKATPFLEQLAQTNPDFQLIDLPNGLTGIAYQGNTDPQVVADAIGRVAPDLLRQWILAA